MSSSETRERVRDRSLEEFPSFNLDWEFDDPDDPQEVTLFPAAEADRGSGVWITIDVSHAVDFDEVV